MLRNAILLLYLAVAVLTLSVVTIAIAVTADSEGFGSAALAPVLAGTLVIIVGPAVAARSIVLSNRAMTYAVDRGLWLGSKAN